MTSPVPSHTEHPQGKGNAAFFAVLLDAAVAKRWLEASRLHLAANDRAAALEFRKRGLGLVVVAMTRAEKLTDLFEHAFAQNAVLRTRSVDCELREHFARRGPIPPDALNPEDLPFRRALREQVYLAACHELLAQGLEGGEVFRQANLAFANATRMHAHHAAYPA